MNSIFTEDMLFNLILNVTTIEEVQALYNTSQALRKVILRKDVLAHLTNMFNLNGEIETIGELVYLATHCYIHEVDGSVIAKYREEHGNTIVIGDVLLEYVHCTRKNIKRGDIVLIGKNFTIPDGFPSTAYIFNGKKLLPCKDMVIPSEFGLITEFGCQFWKNYEEKYSIPYLISFDFTPFYEQMMANLKIMVTKVGSKLPCTTFTHNDIEYTLMFEMHQTYRQAYIMVKRILENNYFLGQPLNVSSCSQSLEHTPCLDGEIGPYLQNKYIIYSG